jgi:pyruvate kinase
MHIQPQGPPNMSATATARSGAPRSLPTLSEAPSIAASEGRPRDALQEVIRLRENIPRDSGEIMHGWDAIIKLPAYRSSATNLALYLALRRYDLSDLQPALSTLGLSSLGRCEGHVMANLDAVAAALTRICGTASPDFPSAEAWAEGGSVLEGQRRALFGHDGEATAIMATLPGEAATDAAFVETLVAGGMDCARINCSHDEGETWVAMARNVRLAARKVGKACAILMDLPGPKCRVETLSPEKPERLHVGDRYRLAAAPGRAGVDLPVMSISFADIVAHLPLDAQVWVDDGKLRGRVVAIEGSDRIIEVIGARAKGEKLRVEKGVNFPGTPLGIPALSADDRAALPVVAEHADMVGFSFVQRPQDIADLDRAIEAARPGRAPMPLVLKIETPEAVRNLPRLIVEAAGTRPCAVMIARGDLAVELGYARMAEIQEEILWLCEAARIPVIWATQVLDELVKEGLPSRAETIDAAMARARNA